jgi:hypothetical protein
VIIDAQATDDISGTDESILQRVPCFINKPRFGITPFPERFLISPYGTPSRPSTINLGFLLSKNTAFLHRV